MALIVNLKSVDNLPGKADRQAKVTFRGATHQSKVVQSAQQAVYFGESFEWPIARPIESSEAVEIHIINYNKYRSNKLVGSYTLLLQTVINDGELKIWEPMVDSNNRIMDATIAFEVQYYSPDGKVGQWTKEEFSYPLLELTGDGADDLTLEETASQMGMPAALLETNSLRTLDAASSSGDLPGEDTASQTALLETMFAQKKMRPELMEQELHRPRDFQVCITILEAQQLAGLDIDPVVRVQVGDSHKYTSIKHSTNCPYYNEYFVFDFVESPAMIFDKMITLTALHSIAIPGRQVFKAGNMLAGRTIGLFKCDVGTVYVNKDHQFFHKWAVLLDPKDISEGPKGYVKCDIAVIGKGDVVKASKSAKDDETNNIEGNLLLPAGVPIQRQRAMYNITIFRGEDLPRTDLGIMASVRKAISLNAVAFIDAFVRISFAGHIGKTKVKKSYHPEWREVLSFVDMFPPLCNRIKVQLCDSDAVKDETIATHFVELAQIMDPAGDAEGILPTFGPAWINLYGAPRGYSVMADHEDLNEGLGEGAAYRGRILLRIKTTLLTDDIGGPSTVHREKLRSSAKVEVAPKREFLLFTTLMACTMIDRDYKDKQLQIEISVGNFGNILDGSPTLSMGSDSNDEDDDDLEGEEVALLRKKKEELASVPCNSSTEPTAPVTDDKTYYYLPIDQRKPCLYVVALFEDLRKRLFHVNLLEKVLLEYEGGLEDVRNLMKMEHEQTHRRLKGVLDQFVSSAADYLRMSSTFGVGAGSGKTKLDTHRIKLCRTQMDKLKNQAGKVRGSTTASNVREKFREAKDISRRVKHLTKEPQHSLPDILIWLLCDKKRVAYHRIPAKDLLFATQEDCKGKHCGKIQTIFLKKPGKKGLGQSGWGTQAKLIMYMWLGQREPKKKVKEYMNGLPEGYDAEYPTRDGQVLPPDEIVFQEKSHYQLRCHLYQARSLIGSDDTGLSDPFARVIMCNGCKTTQVIHETLSPVWNETLVIDDITLYGPVEGIMKHPAMIVVEIFDYDTVGKPEFLGRATVQPRAKIADEAYEPPEWPPQLEWYDVYRGSHQAGELLASFELLQVTNATPPPPLPPQRKVGSKMIYTLPKSIQPSLSKFRFEVLFWGVRELKRLQLFSIEHPRVDVEIGGQTVSSSVIQNMQKNCNFEEAVLYIDVDLPDNEMYWPPINIRCMECRSFGRELLVGICTLSHSTRYMVSSEADGMFQPWKESGKMASGALDDKEEKQVPDDGMAIANGMLNAGEGTSPATLPGTPGTGALGLPGHMNGSFGSRPGTPHQQTQIPPHSNGDVIINMDGTQSHVGFKPDGSVHGQTPEGQPPGDIPPGGEGQPGTNGTMPPPPGPPPGQPAGKPQEEEEQEDPEVARKRRRELIADLDWWSKYYVTKEDIAKIELVEDKDTTENMALEIAAVDYSALDTEKLKQVQEQHAAELKAAMEAAEGKKKKKKKKKKKSKKKKVPTATLR